MRPFSETVINAQSITTNPASSAMDAMSMLQISVQAIIVAGVSPVGTMKVQFSNDPGPSGIGFVPTNWSDVTGATVAINANGVFSIDMTEICARWLRVLYTNTSGTGTISVNVKTNGI